MGQPDLQDSAVGDYHNQFLCPHFQIAANLLGPPPQVVQILFVGVMPVDLVGDRQGGMLDFAGAGIIEPQPLQLTWDINLSKQPTATDRTSVLRL
jgi:hypothetical protein